MGGQTFNAGMLSAQTLDTVGAMQIAFNTNLAVQKTLNDQINAQIVNNATIGATYTQSGNKIANLKNDVAMVTIGALGKNVVEGR